MSFQTILSIRQLFDYICSFFVFYFLFAVLSHVACVFNQTTEMTSPKVLTDMFFFLIFKSHFDYLIHYKSVII